MNATPEKIASPDARNTDEYVSQIHRYLKHWFPDDEMEKDAENVIHEIMNKVDEGHLKVSDVENFIKAHYPAHDKVGYTVDWQILNLWESILLECDIECGI
jgi:hypothetical protein